MNCQQTEESNTVLDSGDANKNTSLESNKPKLVFRMNTWDVPVLKAFDWKWKMKRTLEIKY